VSPPPPHPALGRRPSPPSASERPLARECQHSKAPIFCTWRRRSLSLKVLSAQFSMVRARPPRVGARLFILTLFVRLVLGIVLFSPHCWTPSTAEAKVSRITHCGYALTCDRVHQDEPPHLIHLYHRQPRIPRRRRPVISWTDRILVVNTVRCSHRYHRRSPLEPPANRHSFG